MPGFELVGKEEKKILMKYFQKVMEFYLRMVLIN